MSVAGNIADYHILEDLSVGGHGRFYLATPPARLGLSTDRVVVKVVRGGDETAFRRFTRELRLFARVSHPNLIVLHDAGQHEDQFFYSMEYCPGGSLAQGPRRPPTDVRRAVAQVARAVHALHEAGIVHRDLRPSNILFRQDGSAVLADLGLAQLGSGSVTSMAPTASIGFVDPALLLGDPPSRATDVYSIGATLHWAITGQHLFPGLDPNDAMLAVRTVLRRPPTIQRDALGSGLADFVAACTDRTVDARPPTAAACADILDTLTGD